MPVKTKRKSKIKSSPPPAPIAPVVPTDSPVAPASPPAASTATPTSDTSPASPPAASTAIPTSDSALSSPSDSSKPVPSVDINTPLKTESISMLPEEVPLERKNRFLFLLGIFSITASVTVLAILFFTFKKNQPPSLEVESTPIPTQSAPTSIPFNPNNWTIEVLNGSGIGGVAGKAADQFKTLGYQVIKTGNADKSDYQNTQIYLSASLTPFSDQILQSIKTVYPNATLSGNLSTSSPSARIIIGK